MSRPTASTPSVSSPVQVLSIIFYAGFAISVSIVAIETFWPAGIALAGFFAYQWGKIPTLRGGYAAADDVADLGPQTSAAQSETSGNASFDAYRTELLDRLEQEQQNFHAFLERLRDAADKTEFDRFMTDRAQATKST